MPAPDIPLHPPCKNYKVCGRFAHAAKKNDFCILCLEHFGELKLVSHDLGAATCVICLEEIRCSVLMHCGCKEHVVCVKCFSLPLDPVMHSAQTFCWPSPQQFGCPGFESPTQIDAGMYSQEANAKIYSKWVRKKPAQHRRYLARCEHTAVLRSEARTHAVQTLQRCPVCRAGSPWDGSHGARYKCANYRLGCLPNTLAYLDTLSAPQQVWCARAAQ